MIICLALFSELNTCYKENARRKKCPLSMDILISSNYKPVDFSCCTERTVWTRIF